MAKFDDLTGETINGIKIIRLIKKEYHHNTWEGICPFCNNPFTFVGGRTRLKTLKRCETCTRKETSSTHGLSKTRIYKTYNSMKKRCYNENNSDYKHYGARGIKLCDEWIGKDGFINFYDWSMKNGYQEHLTIDRIDVDGNYEPNNCRWVELKIQENNRTNNRIITFNGETHTLAEWSEITGINYNTLSTRIYQRNWDISRALTTIPV